MHNMVAGVTLFLVWSAKSLDKQVRDIMDKPVVILVQRSRRPRRWAGVAALAIVLTGVLCLEHRQVTHPQRAEVSTGERLPHDSFESVSGGSGEGAGETDHNAQLTDFAFKSSDSTEGATPTR